MRGATDGEIYRKAFAVGAVGLGLVALLVGTGATPQRLSVLERFVASPSMPTIQDPAPGPARAAAPLTAALRHKGYHECNPHDPMGLGPYTPYKNLTIGRIAIPQQGGHTADMGFDVLIHFHGHSAVRKTVVQVARGVAYVGIDKGLGSGPYATAFQRPATYEKLLSSIESALRHHTRDEGAHIRHVALSAWSAGYGAVNEILKHGDERVDAVVLLDGLHAAWNPATAKRDGSLRSLSSHTITPTFAFAKKAARGEKLFVFTHSDVDPVKYPSTQQTADLLLHELGMSRTPLDPGDGRFAQVAVAERGGFHLWSFRGTDELAHCSHIPHVARALALLEGRWRTPEMDRSVPPTPAPKLGRDEEAESPALQLELVDADAGARPAGPMGEDTFESLTGAALTATPPELLPGPAPPAAAPASKPAKPSAGPDREDHPFAGTDE